MVAGGWNLHMIASDIYSTETLGSGMTVSVTRHQNSQHLAQNMAEE
jgi:hypothetical protein